MSPVGEAEGLLKAKLSGVGQKGVPSIARITFT
jgi:hypothetical protein